MNNNDDVSFDVIVIKKTSIHDIFQMKMIIIIELYLIWVKIVLIEHFNINSCSIKMKLFAEAFFKCQWRDVCWCYLFYKLIVFIFIQRGTDILKLKDHTGYDKDSTNRINSIRDDDDKTELGRLPHSMEVRIFIRI